MTTDELKALREKVRERRDAADNKLSRYADALEQVFISGQAQAIYSSFTYSLAQDDDLLAILDALIAKESDA